ncbi:glucose-6-phosphate isomerase [Senegalia massiliensis]|uniref:glucose-6-phosphate isomerase n=1 Tax=Senegalia massiliensis TaxID=1720316 RepID=UPI0010320E8E|nr:glucose-6-phosphate isomerase [Senegalia massiliensis]
MNNIFIDYSNAMIKKEELKAIEPFVSKAHNLLESGKGLGNDYLGWIDLPDNLEQEELEKIKRSANDIREKSDVLLVIGIGGSYLGARAVIEALEDNEKDTEVYFVGNNISGKYINKIINKIKDKDISINVISKSGTTTEPALAFRIFRKLLEDKYGKEESKKRIYATTDVSKGALKKLSEDEGYTTFIIPDNVGGRYSVLTPVGLLPIAVAGIDIDKLIFGAKKAREEYSNKSLENNEAYKYAAVRNILYNRGKQIEILVNYEPHVHFISEWWKQLYGESEGKDGKGIFPSSVDFSTDLHSMGQYIQEGRRNIFETILNINAPEVDIEIEKDEKDLDGLNYLAGKTMDFVNKKAFEGTLIAHVDGGVPNIIINIPKMDEYYLGKLIYFFEKACGLSGYLLGVNPFNQPGVEEYKKNMFALLGKPGYEELRKELMNRIK